MKNSLIGFGALVLVVVVFIAIERDKRAKAAAAAKKKEQEAATRTSGGTVTAATTTTTAPATIDRNKVLKRGDTGAEVRELQSKLNADRASLASRYPQFLSTHGGTGNWVLLTVDGSFGAATENALKRATLMAGREFAQASLSAYQAVSNYHAA
jgi:peptidoglycan hydrolase-like protein with peptidoglycan-binding domain